MDKNLTVSFLQDPNSLSNAHSEESFEVIIILFVRKREAIPEAKVLVAYKKKEWFTERMCMNR